MKCRNSMVGAKCFRSQELWKSLYRYDDCWQMVTKTNDMKALNGQWSAFW
ncbi:hypothetical protein Hdeb2414_s0119g00802521 [Helianthus debilis subsp. tardiflorus]